MISQLVLHGFTYVAQTANVQCEAGTNSSDLCDTGLPKVGLATNANIQIILQYVFGAIGAMALLIIMIAAIRFVVSNGDPQSVAKARQTIIYAAIGLVVAMAAELLVTFVLNNV